MTRLDTITARELRHKIFPPIQMVLPNMLPVGLTICAGRPKIGKSWLGLNAAVAIATGTPFLGQQPDQGSVLYLALEDGERRVQQRLEKMLGDPEWPKGLHVATVCPTLDKGGVSAIQSWLKEADVPRAVLVDVFQRVRSEDQPGSRLYASDYQSVIPLKEIADSHGIAVVAITHTRKAEAGLDPLDAISATTGLVGAADHALILDRGPKGVVLYGRGRDVEEFEWALRFDPISAQWILLGDSDTVNRSDTRNAILSALAQSAEPLGPAEIARRAGLDEGSVKQRLAGMAKSGEVTKLARGLYATPVTSVPTVTSLHQ